MLRRAGPGGAEAVRGSGGGRGGRRGARGAGRAPAGLTPQGDDRTTQECGRMCVLGRVWVEPEVLSGK